jgi:cyclase
MRCLKPLILLAFVAGPGAAHAVTGERAEFKLLADGVYAFIGKRNDANAMAIVTGQGVVVVDTGNNPPESRLLQTFIQSVTAQPVRWVVITQNHGDHTGGTPLFSPPATVIVHDRVAKDWAAMKDFQIRSWRQRFPERTNELAGIKPTDTLTSFSDRMALHLGGKTIELIYVDDPYNPGDVAVWLPDSGILHAGFVGYRERHPDIRPDYSHGTTAGMLKQLEMLSALRPRVVVPAHGPLGDVTDLHALTDYLLLARQKVRAMMAKGLSRDAIEQQFDMREYAGWDRTNHFPATAATIFRELRGEGPERVALAERTAHVTISKMAEEGRFLTVTSDDGKVLQLRAAGEVDYQGIKDRSELRPGMRLTVDYLEPADGKAPLGFDITRVVVERP